MAKTINPENYYTVYYWMSTELGLSGVEKDLYALIYYYYEKMNNECYYSYSQLEQITGTYKNKIIRSLAKLEEGGYIRILTKENGKKYYQIIEDMLVGIQAGSNTDQVF